MLSRGRSAWCTKAELNGNVYSERQPWRLLKQHYVLHGDWMFTGKAMSYCVKETSVRFYPGRNDRATRNELDLWMRTLSQPWTVAMGGVIFTDWIYDHLLPLAKQVRVVHPVMPRAIALAKKKNDRTDAGQIAD